MTDKQKDGLERLILSMGKGLFDEVKLTIDEYDQLDIGIYVDWQYFPKNHGVYKLKDSFLNKVHDAIDTYFKLSGINKDEYMFNTVNIKNNFNKITTEEPLNEIERDWRDKEYTDEYPKFRDRMLPVFNKLVSLKFGKPVKYEITPLSIYEVGNVNQTPQDANPTPPPVNKLKSPEPKYPNLNQTN